MSDNPSSLPPGYEPPSFNTCDDVNERCPVEATIYGDYFTSGACIFFVAIYGLLLMGQSYLGFRARTWSFSIWLNIGIISELMGYSGRLVMSYNPWIYDAFCIQLVMLILGPTFVAASISITFKHLTLWYGPEWSLLKPKLYPWVFVGSDLFSIVIQAAGGIVSAMATSEDTDQHLLDIGGDLLVAGVVFQAANMIICGGLMVVYIVRRKRSLRHGPERMHSSAGPEAGEPWAVAAVAKHGKGQRDPAAERKVKTFIWAITFAYVAIIIRCIYRIPEMRTGWASSLMQNETLFLIMDGAMILLSVLTLNFFHPAFFFPFLGKKDSETGVESHQMESNANIMQQ